MEVISDRYNIQMQEEYTGDKQVTLMEPSLSLDTSDPILFLQSLRWTMQYGSIDDDFEFQLDFSSDHKIDYSEEIVKTAFAAIEFRNDKVLSTLLPFLIKIDTTKKTNGTKDRSVLDKLLCSAVESGQADCVRNLLNAGVNAHTEYCGKPLLHIAAICGYTDVVEELLMAKFPIDTVDRRGATVLHNVLTSMLKTKDDMLSWLLDNGAKTNVGSTGKQLLHLAASNSPVCLDVLLKRGYGVNLKDDVNGETPLHVACNMANTDSIIVLIKHGCQFNPINNNGETPLQKLLRLTKGYMDFHAKSRLELAKKLIAIGFKVYAKPTPCATNTNKRPLSKGREKAFDKYSEIVKSNTTLPSLQHISRVVIRESVLSGSGFGKQVDVLDIPLHLKSYLVFSDLAIE